MGAPTFIDRAKKLSRKLVDTFCPTAGRAIEQVFRALLVPLGKGRRVELH